MTVFKAFLKVLNKCKAPIIMYTVFLIFFGGMNMKTNENSLSFTPSKPDVLIVSEDEEVGLTKHLMDYIRKNCTIIDVSMDEEAIQDALFYRDVNYIIYIPKGFREDFLNSKNPEIKVESTGDYQASLASMMLERYLDVANIYQDVVTTEEELLELISNTLDSQVEVTMTSKLDTTSLEKAGSYYNFTNYCILAGCIYVICLVLSSFKNEQISKRTIVSSTSFQKVNRSLLFSNCLFAILLWLCYVILSFILIGSSMFSMHGALFIGNSFVFMFCAVTLALLFGNLKIQKEAVNGLVNVVALGSSFLCGAFVPVEFLPNGVLAFARILPSYWFIQNNELIKNMESLSMDTISPYLINLMVVFGFSILFIILSNVVSSRKRRIG